MRIDFENIEVREGCDDISSHFQQFTRNHIKIGGFLFINFRQNVRNNIVDFVSALLPSPYTASFQAILGQCISVMYLRRTAGRRLDNVGVCMREHF